MNLPPLADIPPSAVRLSVAPKEWEACLDSWTTLADLYLRLPEKELIASSPKVSSLSGFLRSFYHETARHEATDHSLQTPAALKLRRTCFYLTRRLLTISNLVPMLLDFNFLTDLCRAHAKNAALSRLVKSIRQTQAQHLEKLLQDQRNSLLASLESPSNGMLVTDLKQVVDILRASPDAARLFMTGSDFLDALAVRYQQHGQAEESAVLIATAYFGLIGLAKAETVNLSLLADHIYSLKAQADRGEDHDSLLAALVTNTPLAARLRQVIDTAKGDRLRGLLDAAESYRSSAVARPRSSWRRSKGKGKAVQDGDEMHMHRMSLVTQVRDLFPDLGSGFVVRLLDEYHDDVEQVTAHLLDDSLPAHLRNSDRTEEFETLDENTALEELAPRATPPMQPYIPDRRNVFDDDELDRLSVDTSRLHVGKKEKAQAGPQPNKAAILSALAAFDSDDDERDDTYDVEDVGGTVDTAHPDGEPGMAAAVTGEENSMALFSAYKSSPELFGRTFDVRRGQSRQALKAETGMTDEQIEGWATMLQRDPRRLKCMEAQFSSFDGKQTELGRTAYRESPAGTETEDSDAPAERGGFRGQGRGRGRGRGRGSASMAGPSGDPSTAAAQRRKEANKSSRANHNRRDQRAKKMAR